MSGLAAGVPGRCSVPMFSGLDSPDGFCDRVSFGQQYDRTFLPPRFQHPNLAPYAPGYCCDRHGGPGENDMRFMRDGSVWCAFGPDFENLQESTAGFGNTQAEAAADFRAQAERSKDSSHTKQGREG